MPLILPLIFSLFFLTGCGKHTQKGEGKQGISHTTEVTAERISQYVLEENLGGLQVYADNSGDLEAELSNGRTIMTEACHWSKLKVIEFLISNKVSLDKKDRFGKSPLDYANDDIAIKRAMFPELVIELKRSLFTAAKNNSMPELKKILEANPPVNFMLEVRAMGEEANGFEGETLLTFCILKNLENVLRLLAQPKYQLDVNLPNARGETPLQLARKNNFVKIEKLLIKLGATNE